MSNRSKMAFDLAKLLLLLLLSEFVNRLLRLVDEDEESDVVEFPFMLCRFSLSIIIIWLSIVLTPDVVVFIVDVGLLL